MMRNPQTVRILWIALAIEVGIGFICLLASRSAGSFFVILFILGMLGGAGYFARATGLWTADFGSGPTPANRARRAAWNERVRNTMNNTTNSWNFGNVSFNLGAYPERTEVYNQTVTLEEGVTALATNVLSGSLRVTGQEGLKEIKISATRRVWERDEMAARAALDRLQLRTWQENNTLRIEAGDPTQGFVVGRAPRIDVELVVPASIAANFSTSAGELACRQFHGELNARTTVGSLTVEDFNSGHNINLSTTGGRIALQTVAAGQIRVKAGAGAIQLTGVGAEQFDLETTAGSIRARGVNCGRYNAHATTGNIELYEARIEYNLELKTSAGRIQADNITTSSYRLEATTGTIFWRGIAPTAPSEVINGVGNTQLYFLPGSAFNLEAQSSIGSVETYLPVSALAFQNRNNFNGQIAGGGPLIKVTSQVGAIRVAMG